MPKQMTSGIPDSMYLVNSVYRLKSTVRMPSCFQVGFTSHTNTNMVIVSSTILQITGDSRFQPNTSPHRIQGNTSTGLQAAKDSCSAWLSLNPKYPLGNPYFTMLSTCLK